MCCLRLQRAAQWSALPRTSFTDLDHPTLRAVPSSSSTHHPPCWQEPAASWLRIVQAVRSRSVDEGVRVTVAETVAVIWWSHRRRGGGTWRLRRQRCTLCGLGRGSMTVAEARSAVGEHGRRGRGGRQGPRRGRSAVACRLASSVDYPHVDQLGLIASCGFITSACVRSPTST